MFICESCSEVTPPGISARKAVIKTRERKNDKGYLRTEIVKEIMVCPLCAHHKHGQTVSSDEKDAMLAFTYQRHHQETA